MKRLVSLLLFAFLFPFGSCAKKDAPDHKIRQVVRLGFAHSPFSLDPRKSTEPVTCTFHLMVYEGLMSLNPAGQVEFAIANGVRVSEDKRRYIFSLRPSFWSDGTPLTAYDFECAWKRALDPSYPSRSAHLLFALKNGQKAKRGECSLDEIGVRAIDGSTLLVVLEQPLPYFLQLTAYPTYFPVPFGGKEVPYPKNCALAITNGPFFLASWKNDYEMTVAKNPYYRQVEKVQIDRIEIAIVPNELTLLSLFQEGKLDWIGGLVSPFSIEAIPFMHTSPSFHHCPTVGTASCAFNTDSIPFNNRNIRMAFSLAIDRKLLVEHVTHMLDEPATDLIPPLLKGKSSHFLSPNCQGEMARDYLERGLRELGLKESELPQLHYSYFSSQINHNLAVALQNQWHSVLGIRVNLDCNELKIHFEKLHKRNYDFAQISWVAQYFDPMNYLERLHKENFGRNYSNWNNPEFKKILTASRSAEMRRRFVLLEEAEKIALHDLPLTPLYHYELIYLQNPQLDGIEISPIGNVSFHKAHFRNEASS